MGIDDTDFEEILALLPKENIPVDPVEARQAVENFVELIALLVRPLPLPPKGSSSFKQPFLTHRESSAQYLSDHQSTSRAVGRDSGIGFERR